MTSKFKHNPSVEPMQILEPIADFTVDMGNEPPKQQFVRGKQLYKSPQAKLTTVDSTTFTSSAGAGDHVDSSAIAVLNNMRTRIGELETRLKNLGLLKTN